LIEHIHFSHEGREESQGNLNFKFTVISNNEACLPETVHKQTISIVSKIVNKKTRLLVGDMDSV